MNIPSPSERYRDKGDSVSYTTLEEGGKRRVFDNHVCYGSALFYHHRRGEYELLCRPSRGKNSSPPLVFHRFFLLLRRYGIIPPECRPSIRGGQNALYIPRQEWGYHPLFVTLSMYRHADNHGRSVLGRAMYAFDHLQPNGVHFLQCLHWAFTQTNYGTWHSCINLSGSTDIYEGGSPERLLDLRWGLALACYGHLSWEAKNALGQRESTHMFNSLALDLRNFPIQDPSEILDPQYAPYYADPNKARIQ